MLRKEAGSIDYIRDNFSFNAEICKAHTDSNGDWIVEGVASNRHKDHEGDTILPEGLDYSYFLNKGFIKWEHGKNPDNFIGEPLEAKVVNGQFHIKGRLYPHAPNAKKAVEAMEALEKSNAKRKIGFSIEGSVMERCKQTGRILKSIIRNVSMTFNPVNDTTWAQLVKSLDKPEALEIELSDACGCGHTCGSGCHRIQGTECCKRLGTASPSGQAITPQSLEQDVKDNRNHQEAFMKYLFELAKSFRESINKSVSSSRLTVVEEKGAFLRATKGLNEQEAEEFASYILNKSHEIQMLVRKIAGGELKVSNLAKALDTSMEALMKAIGTDIEEEEVVTADVDLEKSVDTDDTEGDDVDKDESVDKDEDAEGDEVEKSFMETVKDNSEIEKALEISDFLEALVGAVGEHIDGFGSTLTKSFDKQFAVNGALANAVMQTGELLKSMNTKLTEQDELIKSLQADLSDALKRPVGRKSVTDPREIASIAKSLGNGGQPAKLTRGQVVDILVKGFEKGECTAHDVSKFEVSGYIDPTIAQKLNINL